NTDDALELREIPKHLHVVGAGAAGLEMATIYARLGSSVTVVEIMEQILPGMEHELCDHLYKILKKSGIEIYLNSQVTGYEKKDNRLEVTIKKPDGEIREMHDKILVTVGRRPMDAAFKDLGIETDKKGYVCTDEHLRTNIENIFAIGDLVGPPLLAHKATKQGLIVADVLAGENVEHRELTIPSCVFTIPPLSSVGLTEKEALAQGLKIDIGRFPYRASGKAVSMGETEGLVKIIGDEHGKLLGLHILGAESPSLIGEGVLALSKNLSVRDMAEIIHPHPTLTETIGEAAEDFYKKAIHIAHK
ncbi:MAG: FAD-dependent oxidoreductase, partial [candidate division WOR-3 bacterium]